MSPGCAEQGGSSERQLEHVAPLKQLLLGTSRLRVKQTHCINPDSKRAERSLGAAQPA